MKIFCLTQFSQQRMLYTISFSKMGKAAFPCESEPRQGAGHDILDLLRGLRAGGL